MKKLFQKSALSLRQVFLLSCVCLLLLMGISSCKKDKASNSPQKISSNEHRGGKIDQSDVTKISFKSFLDSTKKIPSGKLNNLFLRSLNAQGQIKLNDINSSTPLLLYTDSIKLINRFGHATYTLPIAQSKVHDITFRNLIIDIYNSEITAYIATYTPNEKFFNDRFKGLDPIFSGKMKLESYDINSDPHDLQIQSQKLRTNLFLRTCFTVNVYLYTNHILCTGGGEHVMGATCECDDPQNVKGCNPGYDVNVYTDLTTCYEVEYDGYTPSPGGTGGGGGTSPTPPPGYDPCPPATVASNGLRVQKVDGETPCVPSPPPSAPEYVIYSPTITINSNKTPPCVDGILNSIKNLANMNQVLAQMALFNGDLQTGQENPFRDVSGMISRLAFSNTWNVDITAANIPPDINQITGVIDYPNATTIDVPGKMKTTLDSTYISKASDLSIARTIIHELLHSYFVYAMTNTTDPEYPKFVEINNLLFNKKGNPSNDYINNPNDAQHELMAARYVNQIGKLLLQFATANQITSPNPNLTLEQYCLDLAWGGLDETKAYRKYAPNKNRIKTELSNENSHNTNSSRKKSC